ncbi:hypothetical protein BaRGS_00035330 [Batillaria attramentaria]|uniref:Uncharacterized protein n=1 Tax=Batillaria attramentaria TaxID=370345 RepID=A0ABD0JF16_9CAEN
MMATAKGRCSIAVVLLVIRMSPCKATECNYFLTFPSLSGQVYTVEERSNISLDFRVESTSTDCPIPESLTVTVERQDKGYRQTQCTIKHLDGKCGIPLSQQNTCSCLPEDGHFQLTKVLEQADNTTWWWRLEGNDKQVIFERELVFYITSASDDSSTASWVTSEAPPEGEQYELPHDADRRGPTSLTLESRIHTGSNHESNYYWEIHDEPNPPRSCLRPAPPEDCLHPSESAEVEEGTDDAKNVTPFYENSELRPLELSYVTLGRSSSVVAAVLAHTSVGTVSTPASTDFVRVANENRGPEETKVSAQTGAFENAVYGPETGYMPMNRKLNEGRAETDQESTEYTPMTRRVFSGPPDSSYTGRESGEDLESEADVRRVASLHDVSLSHVTGSQGSEWLSTSLENSC